MPWVYLQSGGVYCLAPASASDQEDQEEMTAALRLFTAQPGVSYYDDDDDFVSLLVSLVSLVFVSLVRFHYHHY